MDTEEIIKEFSAQFALIVNEKIEGKTFVADYGDFFGQREDVEEFLRTHLTAAYEQGRRDAIEEALEKIKIERSKWLATKNASSASYVSARENGFHQVEKILATISTKEEERI